MRADIEELLTRARRLAQSKTARELLRLVDELEAFAQLGSEMQDAQDHYWALTRAPQGNKAQQHRALQRARALEERYRQERIRLGLARQQGLPGL